LFAPLSRWFMLLSHRLRTRIDPSRFQSKAGNRHGAIRVDGDLLPGFLAMGQMLVLGTPWRFPGGEAADRESHALRETILVATWKILGRPSVVEGALG